MTDEEKEKLKVLLEEYKISCSRIETFLGSQRNFLFGGIIIVFGLIRIFQDSREILLGLPFVIIVYTALFLYHYQRTMTNHEYKRHLEKKINELCGEKLLFYTELAVDKVEKENKFVTFNLLSFSFLILLSLAAFAYYFFEQESSITEIVVNIITVLTALLLGWFVAAATGIKKTIQKIRSKHMPSIVSPTQDESPTPE